MSSKLNLGHLQTLYEAYGMYPKTQAYADEAIRDNPLDKPFTEEERGIWQQYANDILREGASQEDIDEAVNVAEKFVMRYGAAYTLFGYDRVGGKSSEIRSIIRVILFYIDPSKYRRYEAMATNPDALDSFYTNPFYSLLTGLLPKQ